MLDIRSINFERSDPINLENGPSFHRPCESLDLTGVDRSDFTLKLSLLSVVWEYDFGHRCWYG